MLWRSAGGTGRGGGHLGCLADSFVHVPSVLGARPEEVRIWQVFTRSSPWREKLLQQSSFHLHQEMKTKGHDMTHAVWYEPRGKQTDRTPRPHTAVRYQ